VSFSDNCETSSGEGLHVTIEPIQAVRFGLLPPKGRSFRIQTMTGG